jgi:hypothetical protein
MSLANICIKILAIIETDLNSWSEKQGSSLLQLDILVLVLNRCCST